MPNCLEDMRILLGDLFKNSKLNSDFPNQKRKSYRVFVLLSSSQHRFLYICDRGSLEECLKIKTACFAYIARKLGNYCDFKDLALEFSYVIASN